MSDDLFKSIQDSKFYIIVFQKLYIIILCLEELVKIMKCHKMTGHTTYHIFYDVEPTKIRKQSGVVCEDFPKHENKKASWKWREALKEAANLAGWELKNTNDGHGVKFIEKIIQEISLELRSINFGFDEKDQGMGGSGKKTTARAVFDHLSNAFKAKSFVGNVRHNENEDVD
nr:Toll/interleukin-1 receptor (TIR) domain-containing protein [Tanacetum cinerariifolium]